MQGPWWYRGGSGICEHGWRRERCKDCGGAGYVVVDETDVRAWGVYGDDNEEGGVECVEAQLVPQGRWRPAAGQKRTAVQAASSLMRLTSEYGERMTLQTMMMLCTWSREIVVCAATAQERGQHMPAAVQEKALGYTAKEVQGAGRA